MSNQKHLLKKEENKMSNHIPGYEQEISSIPLLSDDETEQLINAMKSGDAEARKKLIHHNLRLVLYIARGYERSINLPIEDIISIGSFGIIRAVESYDDSKGAKLSSWIGTCVTSEFNTYLRLSKNQLRFNSKGEDMSLEAEIYQSKDGDGLTLGGLIEYDGLPVDELVIQSIRKEKLQDILKILTREEREILLLRFGNKDGIERTLEEVGNELGLTRERIRQKESKAIKKLRHPRVTRQIKDFFES